MDTTLNKGNLNISLTVEELKPLSSNEVIVLGKKCIHGKISMQKSLEFLYPNEFESIYLEHDVVEAVFISKTLLIKIDKELLLKTLISKVFPLIHSEEILRVNMKINRTYKNIIIT